VFWTRLTVIPTETSPATVPLSRVTGTIEITVVPVLAVKVRVNAPCRRACLYGPTTCSPISFGSGWVYRIP
jgi:hypothetical protein